MDLSEIETFLTIVNTKSITKTADILFLSQPTVSHRLKSLEKELGFPLIVRKKGFKDVELTSKGSEFVSIAERYISLWKETQVLAQDRDSTLCPSDARTGSEHRPVCGLLPADGARLSH
ncbi:MAG: LysR family transcriptional regulator [Enterocloster sp.]